MILAGGYGGGDWQGGYCSQVSGSARADPGYGSPGKRVLDPRVLMMRVLGMRMRVFGRPVPGVPAPNPLTLPKPL